MILSCFKFNVEKQPSRGVARKRCSENLQQIYKKTNMPNFLEITLQHGYSHVNLLRIFRKPFPKYAFGELLLGVEITCIWHKKETY